MCKTLVREIEDLCNKLGSKNQKIAKLSKFKFLVLNLHVAYWVAQKSLTTE